MIAVPRPAIPPLFWAAWGVFGGVLLAEEASWRRMEGWGVQLAAVGAVACVLAASAAGLMVWRSSRSRT
ncbi:MAG TPA: hypothetical protein VFH17_02735, partial [Coriobacteriia bacterium]|nr:hypothetical protein [Coriobacteriia bacterium]